MSYNDYGDEPRRSSRRATREPASPAKVQGSTAAAILVFVAMVGFGLGAVIANIGGEDIPTTTTENDPGDGAAGDPSDEENTDEQPDDSDDGNGDSNGDENGDQEPSASGIDFEMADSAPANEELEYTVRTEPPQPGLELGVERRFPGEDWAPFGDPQLIVEIDDDGEKSGHVITGRVGEAEWRLVGEVDGQRVESNVVTAEITEEEDNSGPGNGNGNNDDD